MLTAIETRYAGTTFRSRLEADYAATFDNLGMTWQYEPEGFKLSDGTWYSPDFYLPGARAWLEVKGDHQQRIDKVEQFAADLWEDAGQPEYEDPTAPMIILARSPRPFMIEMHPHHSPRFHGVRGIGKGQSIGLAMCSHCQQRTFIAYWSRLCRTCGYWHDDGLDWMDSVHDHYFTKMIQLPRPAGRRS